MYLASLPIIAIITNVYPHLPGDVNSSKHDKATNVTMAENKDDGLMLGVLINQFIIFIVGELTEDLCNTIIYSCLCGSLLESVQEGNGGNDI